jgi:hypothetical protein
MASGHQGSMRVFYTADNVTSYAVARMKANRLHFGERESDADLKAKVREGGDHHKYIVEGGVWLRFAGLFKAERDGDNRLARLKAEYQHSVAAPTVEFATLGFRGQEPVEPTTCLLPASCRRGLSKATTMRAISEPTGNSDGKRKAHS